MSDTTSYLDWNATAPTWPEVAEAVREALISGGNPSSVHGKGRAARRAVERARSQIAKLAGTAPDRIVFTSGGTEANQLALKGVSARRVVVSAVEHDSVLAAIPEAEVLPVTAEGIVDLGRLQTMLATGGPALVSVMVANNETGVVQPIAAVADIVHRHQGLLHCDAVQALGKLSFAIRESGADLISLSAHKIGGPPGVGALVVGAAPLKALQTGGGQERGLRAGTENVPGIVGFGVAAEVVAERFEDWVKVAALRDEMECRIASIAPEATVFGQGIERLPNTSCIAMPGVASATQVMALDLAGVMVSAGSACSSGKVKASHVLTAMGASEAGSAIRVSLGWTSSETDIDRLVAAWAALRARTGVSAA